MRGNFAYKLLFLGTLLVIGPFVLTEFLGVDLNSVQTLLNIGYAFGLASIALSLYMICYRGKRKR